MKYYYISEWLEFFRRSFFFLQYHCSDYKNSQKTKTTSNNLPCSKYQLRVDDLNAKYMISLACIIIEKSLHYGNTTKT